MSAPAPQLDRPEQTARPLPLPRSRPTGDPSVRLADVEPAWWTWGGAQGGLVMALAAEAVEAVAPGRTLRALTTHFLRSVDASPLTLAAEPVRDGRSASTVVVRAEQAGGLAALSVADAVAGRPSSTVRHVRPRPAAPEPEDCLRFSGAELLFAFPRQLDIRPVDDVLPLSGSAVPELTAWVRLRGTDVVGVQTALVLLDALAPAAYAAWTEPVVIPTLQLTAHLLADLASQPHTGWTLVQQRHVHTAGGVSVDECDLWAPDGRHLAQARQLRRVLG